MVNSSTSVSFELVSLWLLDNLLKVLSGHKSFKPKLGELGLKRKHFQNRAKLGSFVHLTYAADLRRQMDSNLHVT